MSGPAEAPPLPVSPRWPPLAAHSLPANNKRRKIPQTTLASPFPLPPLFRPPGETLRSHQTLDSFPEVQSMRKQGRVTEPCGQITISTVAIITHLSPQTSLSRPGRPRRPSGLSLRTSLRSLEFRIDATASYGLACPLSVIVGLIRWRRFYRQVVPRCPRALVRCTNAPCSGWPFTTHEWEFGVRPVQGHRK